MLGRRRAIQLKSVALSFLDQAAFGISTFAVTAAVSRSSDDTAFAHFMVTWAIAWTLCALLSELLATPIRLAVPAGEISQSSSIEIVQVAVWATTALVVADAGLLMADRAVTALDVLIIPAAGFSFILRRSIYYSVGDVVKALRLSLGNAASTALLIGIVVAADVPIADWAKCIAATALLVPLFGDALHRPRVCAALKVCSLLVRRGVWFAASTGIRGLVFSSGLLAAVAWAHGSGAAANVGHVFVLASPAQLASSALPLLLLPALVREREHGPASVRRVLIRQFVLYAAVAALGLVALRATFDWWRDALIHGSSQTSVGFTPVALLVIGMLLTSWCGAALQTLRPASFSMIPVIATVIPLGALILSGLNPSYLAAVPYGVVLLFQVALVVSARTPEIASDRPLLVGVGAG